ncbi:MAG: IS701 family transposase [Planctomycetes bacterium]|nr:IS701 family transposase [Planctomycetota bacterium]
MERRFTLRKRQMLEECEVSVNVFRGMLERLKSFFGPFVECLHQPAQQEHAGKYVSGLVSDLQRKNIESIAYRRDEDRQKLQHFIGAARWDHRPLVAVLVRDVGEELGENGGVIVFDPSAFPKKGTCSVGVARQWCGRLGKVDNCQVAVTMGYVSRQDQALVDLRLYLPKAWTGDPKRCQAAGVPQGVRYQTRHAQALEMLREHSESLPQAWIAGDDEMGTSACFRRDLHEMGETDFLAVPRTTTVRDLEVEPPPYSGRGAAPKQSFGQMHRWRETLRPNAWRRIDVRDGEKGPLVIEPVACRVQTKIKRRLMKYDETLVIIRCRDQGGVTKYDYYLSNAAVETPLEEFARVSKAAHRIEECIKRAKSEAGLADYEVRTWKGWHHHQTLSLIATWFLIVESRRGKKMDTCDHRAANPRRAGHAVAGRGWLQHTRPDREEQNTQIETKRTSTILSLQNT